MTGTPPTGAADAGHPLLPPYLLLTLSSLFWSGNFVVGRAIRGEIPPVGLNFWRWVIALAILLPFTAPGLWRNRNALRRHWKLLLALGVTGVSAFNSFVYLALQSTLAINAVLLLAATPLAIVAVSWLLFRDTITWAAGAGMAASALGVVTVVSRGDPAFLGEIAFNPGDLWILLAVPTWAVYSVLLKHRPAELPPLTLLGATVSIGVVMLLPVYLLTVAAGARMQMDDPAAYAALLYVAVFASVLAFICWNQGVREVGPNRAGVFINLMPVFAAGLAIVFLGERIAPYHAVAAVLVFGGIILAGRGRAGAVRPATPTVGKRE